VSELAPDFGRLHERALRLAELAARFGERPVPGQIRWIDLLAHQVRLVESPLDIREALGEQMSKARRRGSSPRRRSATTSA
jgi:ATP-dependent DNA helicase DinG